MLLVSPAGTNVLLMSHAGGGYSITNLIITLDDDASSALPNAARITTGTYRPIGYGTVTFPSPAPTNLPYATTLSACKWTQPNGAWSLYVYDDSIGDLGSLVSGWSLSITTVTPLNNIMDVAVHMSSASPSAFIGANLTNTITVSNLGPMTATEVAVTHTLPAGVVFVSAQPSQGSFTGTNGGLINCSLGTLDARAVATVEVVLRAAAGGSVSFDAYAAGVEEDLDLTNNTAHAIVSIGAPVAATLYGSIVSNQFHLTVVGQPNFEYTIQGSTDLTNWDNLTNLTTSAIGILNYVDTTPGLRARYYRTVH
jgi:uncharacterized repeat protein (TIGR01451 family)